MHVKERQMDWMDVDVTQASGTHAEAGVVSLPGVSNEVVRTYAPNSPERNELRAALRKMSGEKIELPLYIGGDLVRTGRLEPSVSPHAHENQLGEAHIAGHAEVEAAIAAALSARAEWSSISWPERAAIFLRAAELLAGPYRQVLNAATMLGQSKTAHQAEIDSAAELIDFWRFNVSYMSRIYAEQPLSDGREWNRCDYRPLEGFIYAVTPFNFTAIAGNLPTAPALMGNTVIWKPAATAKLSAHYIMQILLAAGLPRGVINLVYGPGAEVSAQVLNNERLAGVHFTGSTGVFDGMMQTVSANVGRYRTYPKVVGETGGKNFILAHPSADLASLATAIIRGGFEYQGQKCSAASRVFVPRSLWPHLKDRLIDEIKTIRYGDVADMQNFMGAVIDRTAWMRHRDVIGLARKESGGTKLLVGGKTDDSVGYFVSPTVLEVQDIRSRFMQEEFFGPIVSVFVYLDDRFDEMMREIDGTSPYGLTGSVFGTDRQAIGRALAHLRDVAGNFYINDKPTGAVVGRQPFGGARRSGTNDKAGSIWNLIRWVSPRTIKETFVPPTDYRYPFMAADQ
jgi:1-pyrroline-5-carboxylate dehydrogenase